MAKLQIVFAAKEPHKVAAFWQAALGYAAEPPPPPFETWDEFLKANNLPPDTGDDIDSAIDPEGVQPRILVERDSPEPRGAVHLDVNVNTRDTPIAERRARVDDAVERFKGLGATQQRVVDRDGSYFIEMTDPEGNWFCVQ
jgi:Glyoxalase-like domain